MIVEHPADDPPGVVVLGREQYSVADDGTVDVPSEAHARTLALRHGVPLSTIQADACDEILVSGDREGEPCGRELPCPYHSED